MHGQALTISPDTLSVLEELSLISVCFNIDLQNSNPALHADETGLRFNGKNSWMHVISNKTLSFFAHHLKRGRQAMDAIGLLEHYKGTLVHDRFSSYFAYKCDHSLCNAHILRDLAYVEERFIANWAK